jgi:ribosomal protein S18 acetylase RimI-like enzyme
MPIEELKTLWQLAFGDSREAIDGFFATGYRPDCCRFLREEGRVAAALYWLDGTYDGRRYAYIYAVATDPDFRGRGLCRKLMAQTQSDLEKLGYAGALLKPGEEGLRRMYEKMGYRTVSRIGEFSCRAGEEGTPLRRLDTAQYARLRREYLPQGALIQEGGSLSYFAAYALFYAGEDCLLAAVPTEGGLFVPELLGNRNRAPQILKTLGYAAGTFRTPGEDIPFAMYHPLQSSAPAPTYVGLAFD